MSREELRFTLLSLLFEYETARQGAHKLRLAARILRVEIELNDMTIERRSS